MRNIALRITALAAAITCSIGACSKNEEQPPPAQPGQYPASPQDPNQYGTPQQPGYPAQQPGYPAQQPGYPPQQPAAQPGYPPAPAAAPAAAPATGQNPQPMGFACQADIQCLTHRCNLQVGKCSWPCQSAQDCQPGFQCVAPACVPTLPQAPQ